MKVDIAICCHKKCEILKSDCLIPIQNGRASAKSLLEMRGDNTGDNISNVKEYYGEGSSIYWMWKNSDADIKGIMQYRRYLNLKNDVTIDIKRKNIKDPKRAEEIAEKYWLTSTKIIELLNDYDILTLHEEDTRDFFYGNIEEQYKGSHPSWVWDVALNIIKEQNIEFYKYILKKEKESTLIFKNMFIAKKQIFDDICKNSLGITEILRKKIDLSWPEFNDGCRTTSRILGFLLERLVGLYILFLQKQGKKIRSCGYINILEEGQISTEVDDKINNNLDKIRNDEIQPGKDNVVVLGCSDEYSGPCATTIESIIENTTDQPSFELVVLVTDLSKQNLSLLKNTVNNRISTRFFDISEYFNEYKSKFFVHDNIAIDTYKRLFIPSLFHLYKKVLWLDSDLVVQKNLDELFNIDLKENWLGAVQDPYIVTVSFSGKNNESEYIRNHLSKDLEINDFSSYFNAGVLLFNIEKCTKDDLRYRIKDIINNPPRLIYQDQDILNYLCKGKNVFWLSSYWNVAANNKIDWQRLECFPKYKQTSWAQDNAFIYHFCGWCKPWDHPDMFNSYIFWKYCRKTPFYEHMLTRLNKNFYNYIKGMAQNDSDPTYKYLLGNYLNHKIRAYKILNGITLHSSKKIKRKFTFLTNLKKKSTF